MSAHMWSVAQHIPFSVYHVESVQKLRRYLSFAPRLFYLPALWDLSEYLGKCWFHNITKIRQN